MPTYPFLSDRWIAAAKEVRDGYAGRAPTGVSIRMNQVVTDVPFGDGTVHAHLDSSSGEMQLDHGHLENPDVTVTVDYATAKALFVDQKPEAAIEAFMNGKIRVQGDMTKLLAIQSTSGEGAAIAMEIAAKIKAITAD